jgi:hypothetical protein
MADRFLDEVIEGLRAAFLSDPLHGGGKLVVTGARPGKDIATGTLQELSSAQIIGYLKAGGDIGFKRKQM